MAAAPAAQVAQVLLLPSAEAVVVVAVIPVLAVVVQQDQQTTAQGVQAVVVVVVVAAAVLTQQGQAAALVCWGQAVAALPVLQPHQTVAADLADQAARTPLRLLRQPLRLTYILPLFVLTPAITVVAVVAQKTVQAN